MQNAAVGLDAVACLSADGESSLGMLLLVEEVEGKGKLVAYRHPAPVVGAAAPVVGAAASPIKTTD